MKIETFISKLDPDAYCTYKGYLYHASDPAVLNHSEPEPLYGKLELERFAELIVAECLSLCSNVASGYGLRDYENGIRDGAIQCQDNIKEHFGIE